MIIKRDHYLNIIISKMHSDQVKIITGIRRCGKSYLLKNLFVKYLKKQGVKDNQIIMIELDDDKSTKYRKDRSLLREDIEKIAKNKKTQYYIILDEIQLVEDFVPLVNSLNKHSNYDVYITGSNSKFLSSDINTEFKDRGFEIRIHPLSFKEYYESYKGDKAYALNDYLYYGGMPYLLNEDDEKNKIQYLDNLVKKVYLTDIVERKKIEKPEELDAIFDVLCSSVGSLINPSRIANTIRSERHINIDNETVFKYIGYFEEAFMFETAKRFNIKGKKYIKTPFKYYPEDVGLRNVRIKFRQQDKGYGIENVVYNELRSRGYLVDIGYIETYDRDRNGKRIYRQKEVDFIARLGSKEYYVQLAERMSSKNKKDSEYESLNKINNSFKKIMVINDDFHSYHNEDGILVISLKEFLLNNASLDIWRNSNCNKKIYKT